MVTQVDTSADPSAYVDHGVAADGGPGPDERERRLSRRRAGPRPEARHPTNHGAVVEVATGSKLYAAVNDDVSADLGVVGHHHSGGEQKVGSPIGLLQVDDMGPGRGSVGCARSPVVSKSQPSHSHIRRGPGDRHPRHLLGTQSAEATSTARELKRLEAETAGLDPGEEVVAHRLGRGDLAGGRRVVVESQAERRLGEHHRCLAIPRIAA